MPGRLRERVPDAELAALPDVRFSTAVRGHDREAVDQYLSRVNQVLEEEPKGLP
jgi:DivIVA domain-containing protein